MEKKKRKYPIHSTVRIPDMDEIQIAASDFEDDAIFDVADSSVKKSAKFPTVDAKPQFDAELSSIKKEMQKLAVVIANEELSKEVVEPVADTPQEESPAPVDEPLKNQSSDKKSPNANAVSKKAPPKK